jgi:hypothetical protein
METISASARLSLGACAAILIASCGAPPVQNALPVSTQQSASRTAGPNHRASWMASEARGEDLIYASNASSNTVTVYTFWGHKLVGELTDVKQPWGLCSDTRGDVWVVGWGKNQLVEYAHGGTKPLKILQVTDPHADLYDCAVDPTTGNLAVTNWGWGWLEGYLMIYPHASGSAKIYQGWNLWYYYGCTYDDKGNLYADGWDAYLGDVLALGKLRKGGSTLENISLLPALKPPILGGIQWDGQHVVIGDWKFAAAISVKGSYGYVDGYTPLTDHWPVGFFWIVTLGGKQAILAPDSAGHPDAVQAWEYPAGGKPTATITDDLDGAFGVTVSTAAR